MWNGCSPKVMHRSFADFSPAKTFRPKLCEPRTGPGARIGCESYNDTVRNMVINYKARTGTHLSFLDLSQHGKADLQSIADDYDYLPKPLTHYAIENLTTLNKTQCQVLEKNTRKQALSAEWREARRFRLTASNFGTICKRTEKRDTSKLCDELHNGPTFKTEAMKLGIKCERLARSKLEDMEGVTVELASLCVNPKHPHLGASPDGFIGKDTLVEIKCPFAGRDEKIKPGKNFPFWGTNACGELVLLSKSNYYYQVQGQLYLTDRSICEFVVYTNADIKVINIPFDGDFCTHMLLPPLHAFYEEHYKIYLAKLL